MLVAKVVQPTVDRKQFKWVGVGWRHLEVAFLCILVCSCGGGSGPSSPPTTLSPDQQIYQQIELSGGESTLSWEFPFGGGPMVFGSDYIFATTTALSESPASGSQTQTPALISLSTALAIPNSAPSLNRVLQAGQVLLAPATASQLISFSGTGIRRDRYAEDGTTIIDSALFFNYSSTPLTGLMSDSPLELMAWLPISNWNNLNVFKTDISWQTGSAYVKSHGQRIGDVVFVNDCVGTTTTADIDPCATGVTLAKKSALRLRVLRLKKA
jgi:hypothetical protein